VPPVAYAIACLIQRSLAAPPRNQPLRRRWPGEFEVVAIVHVRAAPVRLPNFGSCQLGLYLSGIITAARAAGGASVEQRGCIEMRSNEKAIIRAYTERSHRSMRQPDVVTTGHVGLKTAACMPRVSRPQTTLRMQPVGLSTRGELVEWFHRSLPVCHASLEQHSNVA